MMRKIKFLLLIFGFAACSAMRPPVAIEWQPLNTLHMTLFRFGKSDQENTLTKALNMATAYVQKSINLEIGGIDLLTKTEGPLLNVVDPRQRDDFEYFFNKEAPTPEKPWYLVFVFAVDSFKAIKNFRIGMLNRWSTPGVFTLPHLGDRVEQQPRFFPHITLGKITNISNSTLFHDALVKANNYLDLQGISTKVFQFSLDNLEIRREADKSPLLALPIPKNISDTASQVMREIELNLVKSSVVPTPQPQPTIQNPLQNALQTLQQKLMELRAAL